MTSVPHKHKADAPKQIGAYIVTCSTSKHLEFRQGEKPEDASGDIIEKLLREAGHRIEGRTLISDERRTIREEISRALRRHSVDAIIVTGGTGLAPRDVSIESVESFFDKELPGFGEIFRYLSFQKIGSPAIMTRAAAGVHRGKAIFCLPGSPDAVETAVSKLILPEVGHILRIARENP